jgi:acyl carrier protein
VTTTIEQLAAAERVRDVLRQEIARLLPEANADAITDSALLFDVNAYGAENLGLDSLAALELAVALEEECGVAIPPDVDFKELAAIDQIVAYVAKLSNGAG